MFRIENKWISRKKNGPSTLKKKTFLENFEQKEILKMDKINSENIYNHEKRRLGKKIDFQQLKYYDLQKENIF